jgi:hypothetical protein
MTSIRERSARLGTVAGHAFGSPELGGVIGEGLGFGGQNVANEVLPSRALASALAAANDKFSYANAVNSTDQTAQQKIANAMVARAANAGRMRLARRVGNAAGGTAANQIVLPPFDVH